MSMAITFEGPYRDDGIGRQPSVSDEFDYSIAGVAPMNAMLRRFCVHCDRRLGKLSARYRPSNFGGRFCRKALMPSF